MGAHLQKALKGKKEVIVFDECEVHAVFTGEKSVNGEKESGIIYPYWLTLNAVLMLDEADFVGSSEKLIHEAIRLGKSVNRT